ncbi:hypothetical protein [Jiella sp. R10]|uniref:Uncharacterized protein n=2 Tax=Antarcticirhabdus aurantiaca TaxID=2606717 RepID=A0ACD4NK10_9HYPH|nr:hypothetical protein OXU80_20010 [Jeongeuplla avenae]
MPSQLDRVRQQVAAHLDVIGHLFIPGAKLTILVRRPGEPDCDFLMTNDEMSEVAAMVARLSDDAGEEGYRDA